MQGRSLLVSAALTGMMLGVYGCATQIENLDNQDYGKNDERMDGQAKRHILEGKCFGVNSCKGQGACAGNGHTCAGKNSCKGEGWVKSNHDQCEDEGGSFE